MSDTASAAHNSEFVQSLERGLAVIRSFDVDNAEMTLSGVSQATGLTRAAARRFLLTLVDLGYVRTNGRLFALRPQVLELGYSYLSSLGLSEVALPHMEALVAQVQESSSMSVLDGMDITYVARVPKRRIMTIAIAVGTRIPAYATSMGRVLLAGLQPAAQENYLTDVELLPLTPKTIVDVDELRETLAKVARQGYSIVDQELEVGLRSISVPVRSRGIVVAALNVSMHVSQRTVSAARSEILPRLRITAAAIGADLAATQTRLPARRN